MEEKPTFKDCPYLDVLILTYRTLKATEHADRHFSKEPNETFENEEEMERAFSELCFKPEVFDVLEDDSYRKEVHTLASLFRIFKERGMLSQVIAENVYKYLLNKHETLDKEIISIYKDNVDLCINTADLDQ